MVKSKISISLIVLGLLLTIGALGLTAYNFWDDYRAGVETENVVKVLVQYREDSNREDPMPTSTPSLDLPTDPIPGSDNAPERELPVLEIDGNRYIGTISIPVLDLELPVLESWSLALLKKAPCRYMGSPYQGDLIICAHNYATHFGNIKKLTPGDEVIFTDVEGNGFYYAVAELDAIAGTSVQEMENGEWDMTLFTCTLDGQTRVTVRCNLLASDEG